MLDALTAPLAEPFAELLADPRLALAAAGAAIGLAYGVLAESSRFCLLSGLRDVRDGVRPVRLFAFAAAALAALALTQALIARGVADPSASVYLAAPVGLPGVVLGGLLFGLGAALTRGCAGRLTVLAATGNLRALSVILVLALAAYATMRGVLAPLRLPIEALGRPAAPAPDLAAGLGLSRGVVAAVAGLGALALARAAGLRAGLSALALGALTAAGWAAFFAFGDDGLDKLQPWSVAFVAPLANGVQYLMTFTGAKIDFGVAFAGGVLGGAFLSALAGRRLTLQSFEAPGQTLRYLAGGVSMGFGGVLALGCTVGQGLAGLSTLAPASLAALAAIAVGMALGLLLEKRRETRDALVLAPAE